MSTSNLKYIARTGTATINVANPNLNGTGSITSVITGQLDGTIIKSITVKATGSTSEGMVRLYYQPSGGTNRLINEIFIPETTQTGVVPAFEHTWPANFNIMIGDQITASTQNADTFNIIIDGSDFQSCPCAG